MIRMGGTDAMMLSSETPSAYMHTFKVAILDPSTDPDGWSFRKFHDDFASRIHLVPLFLEKQGRHGGVDTAGHADDDFAGRIQVHWL